MPGDAIIGYITRGRGGISVHRADCPPNVANLDLDTGRQIEVKWNAAESDSYPVEIEIEALDKPNLLTSIMNALSEKKTSVEAVTARTRKHESAMIQLVLEIHDVEHLNTVMGDAAPNKRGGTQCLSRNSHLGIKDDVLCVQLYRGCSGQV